MSSADTRDGRLKQRTAHDPLGMGIGTLAALVELPFSVGDVLAGRYQRQAEPQVTDAVTHLPASQLFTPSLYRQSQSTTHDKHTHQQCGKYTSARKSPGQLCSGKPNKSVNGQGTRIARTVCLWSVVSETGKTDGILSRVALIKRVARGVARYHAETRRELVDGFRVGSGRGQLGS
jgi:hypothetical protein